MARKGLSMDQIVLAAMELIKEKGYDNFSLRELAGVLSVKPASLYNHTTSVSEITSAVGHAALKLLGQYLEDASSDLHGTERLSAMAAAYRKFAKENEELYKAIVHLPAYEDDTLKEDGHAVMQLLYGAMEPFGLADRERVMFARAFRSSIHGFISLEMAGYFRKGTSLDESYVFLVNNMLLGLSGVEKSEAGG